MSLVVSTPNQICNHPVNSSRAKMLWTFSKSPKDGAVRKSDCTKAFYDLPSVRASRTAGFGYGTKSDFTKTGTNNPPPNAYELNSEFKKGAKKGFSFGLSREAMAATGGQFVGDKKSPGPGAYDTRETNKTALSYSFRPRTNMEILTSPKFVPGPGTYPIVEGVSPKGTYPVSKFKNSGATLFSPPRSKRFADLKSANPGPGTYNPSASLTDDGSYFVSKFRSSMCRTFSHGVRKNASLGSFEYTPGPGSYRLPSDFGYYESSKFATKTTPAQ